MDKSLRVIIADDDRAACGHLQKILGDLGHAVVAACHTGRELIDRSRSLNPDVVIADVRLPDVDGLAVVAEISRPEPVPVLAMSDHHDPELVQRAARAHVLAFLLKPIKEPELDTAIVLAVSQFEQFSALRHEAADLRQALFDRKVVERAKGILMLKRDLSEQDAFRWIQKRAMDENRKLVDIAQMVLTMEELLRPPSSGRERERPKGHG